MLDSVRLLPHITAGGPVCRYVAEGTILRNYADVLVILMKLRQHCCHPDLLAKPSADLGDIFSHPQGP